MKSLLLPFLISFQVFAATVTPPIINWNPHTGTPIDTPWDHKGIESTGVFRLLPPNKIEREVQAMNGVSICKDNMSRCEAAFGIPICIDATGIAPSEKCKQWNIFELWRFRREAVQDRPQRVVFIISPTLSAAEIILGKGKYQPLLGYDQVNGILSVVPHPSNVNYVTLGDVLKVSGGGRIELGPSLYVLSKLEGGGLSVGDWHIATKDGVKYLKVIGPDGKKYGARLELIE